MSSLEFLEQFTQAGWNTLRYQIPCWILGLIFGLFLSFISNMVGGRARRVLYAVFCGASVLPVTILIPFFLRWPGIPAFLIPLLGLPVALYAYASIAEGMDSTNRHRETLVVNLQLPRYQYFFDVALRESMPSIRTAARQTLAMSLAIFVALDYFLEFWEGLGALTKEFYRRSSWGWSYYYGMLFTIVGTFVFGGLQILVSDSLFRRLVEFRRHY